MVKIFIADGYSTNQETKMVAEMEEILNYNSDDEVAPVEHNKLLAVVSKLYEKKRVGAPSRNEPSLEVSEFHLTQAGDRKKERVQINALAQVLKSRPSHAEINKNLRLAQKTAKTLPKPLEKPQAQKIVREVGYENVKKQLNRWDAIVYSQRVAEQVKFPLKSSTVHEHKSSDFLSRFRTQTPLEQEVERILKESAEINARMKNENTEDGVKEFEENEEEEFPLTLEEIMERRQLAAKVRAQQSYKQYKARRQNKIKSKKYHRILKRQRIKEQLREFEELQKKDPEAALKKLEQLDKTRAEERVSLRHRSTGQWAKNQAVRAKYDKEARIALAEQLARSRELTAKLHVHKDSSDEEGDNEEKEVAVEETDKNNPWTSKDQNEVEAFYTSYRKFWEEKHKETETNKKKNNEIQSLGRINDSNLKSNVNNTKINEHLINRETDPSDKNSGLSNTNLSGTEVNSLAKTSSKPSVVKQNTFLSDNWDHKGADFSDAKNNRKKDVSFNKKNNSAKKTKSGKNKSDRKSLKAGQSEDSTVEQASSCKQTSSDVHADRDRINNLSLEIEDERAAAPKAFDTVKSANYSPNDNTIRLLNRSGCWVVSDDEYKRNDENGMLCKENEKPSQKRNKKKKKKKTLENSRAEETQLLEKSVNINEIFDEMEDKVRAAFEGKLCTLKQQLSSANSEHFFDEESHKEDNENKNIPSLEMTKKNLVPDEDEELEENSESVQLQKGVSALDKLTKTIATPVEDKNEASQSDDIDPNKFFSVNPKQLKSKLPDLITEGEDALDDEEEIEEQHHLTISEAFADDDVVDAFRRKKDEEIKKNAVERVDLSMPGWGSWAGHNITRREGNRKRKKFAINIPEKLPRKDDSKFNVIINEDMNAPVKEHRVSELPYPFTSIHDFEAAIRAPVGRNWVPQIAHCKLIAPPVVTKLGTVIEPMNEDQLIQQKKITVKDKSNKFSERKKS